MLQPAVLLYDRNGCAYDLKSDSARKQNPENECELRPKTHTNRYSIKNKFGWLFLEPNTRSCHLDNVIGCLYILITKFRICRDGASKETSPKASSTGLHFLQAKENQV